MQGEELLYVGRREYFIKMVREGLCGRITFKDTLNEVREDSSRRE